MVVAMQLENIVAVRFEDKSAINKKLLAYAK